MFSKYLINITQKIKELDLFFLIILLGLSFLMFGVIEAGTLESWQSSCGAVCLRTVTGLLGNHTDLAEIRDSLKENEKGGVSLAEISETGEKMGFYTIGLRIKSENIQECSLPLIAHKEPKHFVVFLGLGKNKGVILIDPPYKPKKLTINELSKQQEYWNVVAVSKYPIHAKGLNTIKTHEQASSQEEYLKEFGGLKYDNVIWNFGIVKPGYKKEYNFSFENISKNTITLSSVKANCACLKVLEFTSKVTTGQHGQIKVIIDTKGLQGYIEKNIICVLKSTGYESEEKVLLKVIGEVSRRGELLLNPSSIHLPDIIKGSTISKTVIIKRIGNKKLLLNDIKSDSDNIKAEIIEDLDESAYEATINIQYEANGDVGQFEHNVIIKTDFPEYPTANLRIYGNIVPHINTEPQEVLFSLISEQSSREKIVNLKSQNNKSFTITNIETTNDDVEIKYEPLIEESTAWQITLTASQNVQKGIFKGEITVTTDDSELPKIEIPYTGLVVN